jgi:hypothetical protein
MTTKRIQSIDIPEEEQGILTSILRLSDPAFDGLERALCQARPTLDKLELISQLRTEPSLADVRDLEQVVGSLLSIAGTAYYGGAKVDEIIDAVIEGIKSDNIVEITDSDAEALKFRLEKLSRTKSVELGAKAIQLLGANDRSFDSVRVVTDLRPIYSGEGSNVSAGVIVHQLAVRAKHNSRDEVTYIALDSLDLAALNAAVSRALLKDKALRDFAKASNTPILTPPPEE